MPTEKLSLSRKCRALGRTDRGQHGIRTMRCGLRQNSSPLRPRWVRGRDVRSSEHGGRPGVHPKGRRLAAAHYGGASLWSAKAGSQKPKSLAWAGSHLSLTWSPDGKYIVTATQENDLHGWRVSDGADMRMSG